MNEFDFLKPHAPAKEYLASKLAEGSLVLFLGAGTSYDFGLPGWVELINFLNNKIGAPALNSTSSADELQFAADSIESKVGKPQLLDWITECLYSNVNSNIVNSLKNHLLVSIAALLMGSKRGHVTRVVTLNYDNMLEWFLSLFGFVVKTIYDLPALEGSEDVRVYHPHGFLPNPATGNIRSNFLILTMDSAHERIGTPGEPWVELIRHILNSGICLFIGLSARSLADRVLGPLFNTCGKKHIGKRPLGFWILKEDLTEDIELQFDRNYIIPLEILDSENISEFLLEICQEAAKKIT